MERSAQVIVVGGGPTGLMAALALASARVDTILVRGNPPTDNRTTALLASSKTALETLGRLVTLPRTGRSARGHADRR